MRIDEIPLTEAFEFCIRAFVYFESKTSLKKSAKKKEQFI
jgi:hypothetical protein